MKLPPVESLYPSRDAGWGWFWCCYAGALALTFPLAVLWQVARLGRQGWHAVQTQCRAFSLLDDRLVVKFLARGRLLQAAAIFGQSFVAIRYCDVLIDPGPTRAWREVERFLETLPPGSISKVLCTHYHEEHIGVAAAAAERLGVPVYGTRRAMAELRRPSRLPFYRRLYIGQPAPCSPGVDVRELPDVIELGNGDRLRTIPSPGHCEEHVSFYGEDDKILFSGDSYLGERFTHPNGDVDATSWIQTLEAYASLDVATVVEGHGKLYTLDPRIPPVAGLVVRAAPRVLFERKCAFLRWAREAVACGETRGLDPRLIEACLFRPERRLSWSSWARDESYRFFSLGEFSRTQFVRSLSASRGRRFDRSAADPLGAGWRGRRIRSR